MHMIPRCAHFCSLLQNAQRVDVNEGGVSRAHGPELRQKRLPRFAYSHRAGADTVAMSVVEEGLIAARHAGMRVLGLSLVSNKACGIEGADPNSDQVMDVAEKVKPEFTALMNRFSREARSPSVRAFSLVR